MPFGPSYPFCAPAFQSYLSPPSSPSSPSTTCSISSSAWPLAPTSPPPQRVHIHLLFTPPPLPFWPPSSRRRTQNGALRLPLRCQCPHLSLCQVCLFQPNTTQGHCFEEHLYLYCASGLLIRHRVSLVL